MDNTSPSQEEIKNKREFAYRAFSPDSEPPSPTEENRSAKDKTDSAHSEADPNGNPAQRETGRQSA